MTTAEKGRGVAGMPAFLDPYNPDTMGGSVNFGHPSYPSIEEGHPVEHSADYGGLTANGDREEWSRERWAKLAKEYDLAVGGSKQDVIDRVLAHEAQQKEGE